MIEALIPKWLKRRIIRTWLRNQAKRGRYMCVEERYGTNNNLKRWRRV